MGVLRRSVCIAVLVFVAFPGALSASDPITGGLDLFPVPPGVSGGAVGAFLNPAAWGTVEQPEGVFLWDDANHRGGLDNWGLSVGKGLGFSALTRTYPGPWGSAPRVTDYQIGVAGGDRGSQFGVSWRWSGGDRDSLGRGSGLGLGFIQRPSPFLSVGVSGFLANVVNPKAGMVDVGLRPLGSRLTVFGDWTVGSGESPRWGAGAEVRPVAGIHLGALVREAPGPGDAVEYGFRIGVALDRVAYEASNRLAEGGGHLATRQQVRLAPPFRGLPVARALRSRSEPRLVVPVSLENKVLTYQRDRWFDDAHVPWLGFSRYLDAIRDDPGVQGVALNLSGLRARASLVWELRQKIDALRAAGKTVYVHADRLSMGMMWLAAAADSVSLDPEGHVMLQGISLQRTYMAGLLDKLGLGAEEWRYLTYKSAFETYTRTSMSDTDREQYQRIADVIYETWRDGIMTGRRLSRGVVDRLVNEEVRVRADAARAAGLVDMVGRWPDLQKRIGENSGARFGGLPADARPTVYPDDRWGRLPVVAVVYATGPCAMDEGIHGRATSKVMNQLAKNPRVKAVVLRADSPGGDPLPSDLVAEGVLRIRDAGKPVVVSQGDVAASGGYWIGMNGTEILTTPLTITGSIGVIAGWVWDEGFGKKVGFSADGVQRGIHADLFSGIRFPLVDQRLPLRNLDADEKAEARDQILGHYGVFVSKVASGRGMTEEAVNAVAQGRVWMGGDAVERSLCDGFGGLSDAVARAKQLAGLDPDEDVEILEYPPQRAFRLPQPFPEIPKLAGLLWGTGEKRGNPEAAPGWLLDYGLLYLRSMAAAQGAPLALTPPEALPDGWYGVN